ncbi:MAG: helix-turn-helix domain-containing protein [Bacteroidota bacterium]
MKDRLNRFLEHEKLSPARFAELIDVQRSSISHLLSGRNNPSFDFIQRMLRVFPYLNAEWLILGEGEMISGEGVAYQGDLFGGETLDARSENVESGTGLDDNTFRDKGGSPERVETVRTAALAASAPVDSEKEIEKVLVFFRDKTFRVYMPEL